MHKNIYLDSNGGNYIAALAEGTRLLEYHIERIDACCIVGNIYKGKVVNVINGMQAAFVNIGLKKNAYLNVNELLADERDAVPGGLSPEGAQGPDEGGLEGGLPAVPEIKEGDEILVQVIKDGTDTKGVKCSPHLSFAGKYVVFLPGIDIVGVSRKIENEKTRRKLTGLMESIRDPKRGGFIVRTAAENVSHRAIRRETEALYEQYDKAIARASQLAAPALVHEEGDLVTRMLRDVYTPEVERIYFADRTVYEQVRRPPAVSGDDFAKKAVLFDRQTDMFKYFGLDAEVDSLLRNRVELDSGAYLIIDKTEALTVIDVNTGKFTGTDNLEDTAFSTNILAAKEIARQVRLRNTGGIVVVDFIDMTLPEHRDKVVETLENALKSDRSKCNVLGMSALGLVEFTRKKKYRESTSMLVQSCPYCRGDGLIYSNDYIVLKLRTALLDLFAQGYSAAIIDLNADLADYILKKGVLSSDVSKIWRDKRIYIVPHRTYHLESYRIRGDNSKVLDLPDKARLLF